MLKSILLIVILSVYQTNCKLLFGSTPIQILNDSYDDYGQAHYLNISTMSIDNDIISIHEDCNWGCPWNAFWNGTVNETLMSPRWIQHLSETLNLIKTTYKNKPIFISFNTLSSGNPGRSCPARNVTYNEGQKEFVNCAGCYDFNETNNKQALSVKNGFISYILYYLNYFISNGVNIQYVNHCTECNFYIEGNVCSLDKWNSVKLFANNIYDAIKNKYPNITLMPSFQVESFRGQLQNNQACYNKTDVTICVNRSFELIQGMKYDVVGLSSYPYTPPYIANIYNEIFMHSDYLNVIMDKFPKNTRFGIAETEFVTSNVIFDLGNESVSDCHTNFYSNISRAMDWMNYIGTEIADKYNLEIFTWFQNSDLEPQSFALECPCKINNDPLGNQYFCEDYWDMTNHSLFKSVYAKVFSTTGLRAYNHSKKAGLYDLWLKLQSAQFG